MDTSATRDRRREQERRPHYVYKLWGERDCLYVGMTSRPDGRLGAHSGKFWWTQVRRIEADWYPNKRAARAAETEAIQELQPLYNWYHTEQAVGARKGGVMLRRKAEVLGEDA